VFQLQDLRRVIARMLAVDTGMHAVPDCEIISRLEKLILATQASSSTPMHGTLPLMDDIMDELSDQFRSGYHGAGYVLAADGPEPRGPAKRNQARPRSVPRRLDSKVY